MRERVGWPRCIEARDDQADGEPEQDSVGREDTEARPFADDFGDDVKLRNEDQRADSSRGRAADSDDGRRCHGPVRAER